MTRSIQVVFVLLIGGALVAATVVQVFQDLFHPGESGALSDWVGRRIFNLLRRSRFALPLAGPLTLVTVILLWVAALIIGFGFILSAFFPAQFRTGLGAVPPADGGIAQSLYFSFETLITLGYGDLVPHGLPLRLVACVEALIGFAILTASVSSIVLVYPALSRMRALARHVAHLTQAEIGAGTSIVAARSDVLIMQLAAQVTAIRIDLVHFPMTYYFAPRDCDASVARWTAVLERWAGDGQAGDCAAVRIAAGTLDGALTDFAVIIATRFLHMSAGDRRAVFAALARDHGVDVA